jgi:cell division protein FtsB
MSDQAELDPVLVQPLRRPRPKAARPAETPLHARPAVVKTAIAIVAAVAVVAFAGRMTGIAAEPVLATYRTGQDIKHLQKAMTEEQAVNAQLRQDISYLKTRAGVEQEARRRGWVRPNEIALSVVLPEESAGESEAKRAVQAEDPEAPRSISDRVRNAVETCLAVLGRQPRSGDRPKQR